MKLGVILFQVFMLNLNRALGLIGRGRFIYLGIYTVSDNFF